jgi:hypothetical protein
LKTEKTKNTQKPKNPFLKPEKRKGNQKISLKNRENRKVNRNVSDAVLMLKIFEVF